MEFKPFWKTLGCHPLSVSAMAICEHVLNSAQSVIIVGRDSGEKRTKLVRTLEE